MKLITNQSVFVYEKSAHLPSYDLRCAVANF